MAANYPTTGNWSPVGASFFRKFELYTMQWQDPSGLPVHLDQHKKVICAVNGGPIALWREVNYENSSSVSGAPSKRAQIDTYTSAGQRLGSIKRNTDNLFDIAWSYDEHLLFLHLDGRISVSDMHGTYVNTVSFGSDVEQAGVADCRFFVTSKNNSGVAVLTNTSKFHVISNIAHPRKLHVTTDYAASTRPSCWCFVPSTSAGSSHALLFGTEENVYKIDVSTGTSELVTLPWDRPSPLCDIVPSPDRSRLAFLTASYGIIVTSFDMKYILCSFDKHKFKSPPKQFLWCGNDAVAAYWHELKVLQLIAPPPPAASTPNTPYVVMPDATQTPRCSTLPYKFDSARYFVTEIDGLRSVGQGFHEFIQKVPQPLVSLCRIGSRAPGAVLLDAYRAFDDRKHQANELMRLIEDKREEAVNECIQASAYEDEPLRQKSVLRAAAFGKTFIDELAPSRQFYSMCQMLRVLNAVRNPIIGMPLSYDQLMALTPPTVVDRLVARRHFPLAMEIANFLDFSPDDRSDRVLNKWAMYKVGQQAVPNEQISRDIVDKLRNEPGVSFARVAEHALLAGRKDVAERLLVHEPNPYKQVRLLLRLGKSDLAMKEAIESLDPALMYEVVLHMKQNLLPGDFYLNLRIYPMACLVYQNILQEHDAGRRDAGVGDSALPDSTTTLPGVELRSCYFQDTSPYMEALCRIRDAYVGSADLLKRQSELQQASAAFARARRDAMKALCDDQRRLWKQQREWEEKFTNQAFVDKPLHDTLRTLLRQKQYRVAEDVKKEYGVTDKLFWYLKIDELARHADWEEFERFAKRKSPLDDGYWSFFNACVKYGHRVEASKMMSRLTDEQRIDGYLLMGQVEQAATFAYQKKDDVELERILEQCPHSDLELALKIKTYLSQLGR